MSRIRLSHQVGKREAFRITLLGTSSSLNNIFLLCPIWEEEKETNKKKGKLLFFFTLLGDSLFILMRVSLTRRLTCVTAYGWPGAWKTIWIARLYLLRTITILIFWPLDPEQPWMSCTLARFTNKKWGNKKLKLLALPGLIKKFHCCR